MTETLYNLDKYKHLPSTSKASQYNIQSWTIYTDNWYKMHKQVTSPERILSHLYQRDKYMEWILKQCNLYWEEEKFISSLYITWYLIVTKHWVGGRWEVLCRTNTLKVIWRLSSFTGEGRPHVPLHALFKTPD